MGHEFKLAVIGLDTSHAVELPRLINDRKMTPGLRVTHCLSFETPFQNAAGLLARKAELNNFGITVTENYAEAVADCDGMMLEINDASLHLAYFERCAALGKPMFLDKPFADTLDHAKAIDRIARRQGIRYFTASPLRFDADLVRALSVEPLTVDSATVWGPFGKAAAGSSLIWYGCHALEMLERIMGGGALSVTVGADRRGYVGHVRYGDGRRGIVELTDDGGRYGGVLREWLHRERLFQVSGAIPYYQMLIREIAAFFLAGAQPVAREDAFEVMALLEAFDRAAQSGRTETVDRSWENA